MQFVVCLASFSLLVFAAEAVLLPKAYQSSILNDNVPLNAVDSDPKTCSTTGYEIGGWWKVDFGYSKTIRTIQITGATQAIHIRVGDGADAYGIMGGFDSNALCSLVLSVPRTAAMNVTCGRALTGRYLSIQALDNAQAAQLELCDLKFYNF